ncbi:MAG: hypothetical protein ACPGO6_02650, partial [Candidatus Poseidoniaceae archaeon]
LSIVAPSIIEKDAKTPSQLGLAVLLIVSVGIIFITSVTENMLSNLLLLGSIPMIISNVIVRTIVVD